MDKKLENAIAEIDFELYNYALDPHWRGATVKQATNRICKLISKKNKLIVKLGTTAEVNKPQSGDMA
jgi:hypothetical protein